MNRNMFIWINNTLELAIFRHKMKQHLWSSKSHKLLQHSGWIHLDKQTKTYKWTHGQYLISAGDVIDLKHLWKWGPYSKDEIRYNKINEIL